MSGPDPRQTRKTTKPRSTLSGSKAQLGQGSSSPALTRANAAACVHPTLRHLLTCVPTLLLPLQPLSGELADYPDSSLSIPETPDQ